MHVIIVGAGEVGCNTAEILSREGHDVVVIEADNHKLAHVESLGDIMTIEGSGAHPEALEAAGVKICDLFIAVTNIDEVNIVACLIAKEYGVPTKIARAQSFTPKKNTPALSGTKLGIEMLINPMDTVAYELGNLVVHSKALEVAEFADGRILFVGYPLERDNPVCGLSLTELGDLGMVYPFVVTAITRKEDTIIPRGNTVLMEGDRIFLMVRREDHTSLRYLFGFDKEKNRRILILGGGDVGFKLASQFEREGARVTIADPDQDVCEHLADHLDTSLVLNIGITDVGTLLSEGLAATDVVVSVSDNEETNILAALLAKKNGVPRAISVVNSPAYVQLATTLGIDACISPRLAMATAILKYVRRGEILSIVTVEENHAEVLEILIPDSPGVSGKTLREVDFPKGAVVGAIVRADSVELPSGDTVLAAGDRAVVFTVADALADVEKFFEAK